MFISITEFRYFTIRMCACFDYVPDVRGGVIERYSDPSVRLSVPAIGAQLP